MDQVTYKNNGQQKTIAAYSYDDNGLLANTAYGQDVIDTAYSFDNRQRLENITAANNDDQLLFNNSYQYDRASNRVKTIGTYQEETGYQYDDLDRLVGVDYPGTKKMEFNYDQIGNRKELMYKHGTTEDEIYKYSYNYNLKNNQLTAYSLSKYTHYEYVIIITVV